MEMRAARCFGMCGLLALGLLGFCYFPMGLLAMSVSESFAAIDRVP